MIKYLVDVLKFMKRYPYKKGDKFFTWLRNCLYLNWQIPWVWNIDIYWLVKRYAKRTVR